jgi:DNA-directed RNA polymerase
MSHIMKCMDYLGSTKWVVNKQILAIIEEAIELTDTESPLMIPGIAALVAQEKPAVISKGKVGRRTDLLQQLREKQKQENERPILLSKLRIARDMQHARALYFPHSIDFRGRAYPIPAPFNHQGDDICRSLLRFGDKKRLGPRGWFWLRVHAANMFGVDKVAFEDRLKWVEDNMEKIILLANEPFAEKSLEFVNSHTDDFWQTVNVASEIRDAVISGNPEEFMSNLPIHQDGSCNGLQHYAALGRDSFGAKAVNIVPSEKVEDVYTVVLNMVKERIRQDAQRNVGGVDDNIECPSQFAHLKSGQGVPALARQALASAEILQRKTVKQTVMTICYGVTQIGASDQVHKQLKELGIAKQLSSAQLAVLSSYIARTILGSIDEVFKQAMQIKKWFDTVAVEMNKHEIPVAWISPAGVICRQPYRKQKMTEIRTLVQKITIVDEEEYDKAPISAAKQRLGFPPNFVHSLDASHMMLTANACKEAGLTFAAVHDSFWTHACDVDTMNVIIREEFYKMYSEPILEKLRDSLVTRLGENGHNIPPLPQQGDLDLKCVLESPFFFD